MGFRYRPGFNVGKNIRVGKTGITVRTGIPGLTYRTSFSSTSSASSGEASTEVELPSLGRAVFNIIALIGLVVVLTAFATALWKPLGYVVPLLFLGRAYKSLFREYAFGWKEEAVYKSDRRYKTGQRYQGSRLVVDKENKIYYTPQQRLIARLEGTVKVLILGLAVMYVAMKPDKIKTLPNAPLSIKNLTIGSPISNLKRQEKRKLQSFSDTWYYVEPTTYANELGKLDVHADKGLIEEIEFTPADTTAYPRLAKLLYAKYGAAQDTITYGLTWSNDSLKLELSKLVAPSLKLRREGIL